MERVVERGNAKVALKRVRQNMGSPGIDGMTVDELSEYLAENREAVRAKLLDGTYQSKPVKRQEIPTRNTATASDPGVERTMRCARRSGTSGYASTKRRARSRTRRTANFSATVEGVPARVDDPLGSDAFGPEHYSADVTELGPHMHADRTHGYVSIDAHVPVLEVAIWSSDNRVLWHQERPTGSYRLDIAPGSYFFVQVRANRLDPNAKPIPDPKPFETRAGQPERFMTSRAPKFAPIP